MVNLLNKTLGWVFASACVATAGFAQTNEVKSSIPATSGRGHEMSKELMMPIYNAPARIDVRSSWDLYVTGRFLYWQAREENLEIGLISRNDPEGISVTADTPFTTFYVNNMNVANQRFTYRPGFKIGLGANLDNDNWDAYTEYTWFHSSTTGRVNPLTRDTASTPPPNGEYLYPIQGAAAAMDSALLPPFFLPKRYPIVAFENGLCRCFFSPQLLLGNQVDRPPLLRSKGSVDSPTSQHSDEWQHAIHASKWL